MEILRRSSGRATSVNHQRLKHVGLHFQICWHGNPSQERSAIGQLTSGSNPYRSCHRMVWPSPFGQRRMLYSPRCHHRIHQATLGLTHAGQEVFRKCISQLHIESVAIPPISEEVGFLATGDRETRSVKTFLSFLR